MIVVPASLRSDFIHMAGMTIHIALESTIHIVGIRIQKQTRFACSSTAKYDVICGSGDLCLCVGY